MNSKIGYARVSTQDQSLDLQLVALRKAGCTKIFTDFGLSGAGLNRPGLIAALAAAKNGDTLVVWRLDRLGRSLQGLITMIQGLGDRGVEFQSLNENIDTSSSGGRLLFHIMAALAEFERSLISERTRAGMEAARLKGKHLGRKPALSAPEASKAKKALAHGKNLSDVAAHFGITKRTLKRYISMDNSD